MSRSVSNLFSNCGGKRWPLAFAGASALAILLATVAAAQESPQFPAGNYAVGPTSPAATATELKVEAYTLDATTHDIFVALQQQTAGRSDMRVAIDERTSQALVYGSPTVHAQLRQQLAAKIAAPQQLQLQPQAQIQQQPQFQQQPQLAAAVPAGPAILQLQRLPAGELHARLEQLLSRTLPATADASGEWQSFIVEASPGIGVTMNVNTRTGQIRIDGPPQQIAGWRNVIQAIDAPPSVPGRITQLVTTKPASHDRVRKALQVLQTDAVARPQSGESLVETVFQQPGVAGQLVAQPNIETPPAQDGAPPSTAVAPGSAQTALDAAKLAEAAGGLLGPVQVEFVEGLDVIVLRGSERDVQRVMDIIKEIEDLSAVTVPDVQIYELKSVDSVRMAALLQRLYDQVLGPRIGTVSITPLGKPNALLLIGRQENVRMAIELIQRLDQPVNPLARFEVFPLKHASATEAKTLIDGFLGQGQGQGQGQPTTTGQSDGTGGGTGGGGGGGGTGGGASTELPSLAPRALVVADPRTNSLIVSASPRDIAEVAALISRIDTPGAAAELKVFTVVNGDAAALVQMLRSLFSVTADAEADTAGGGLSQGGPVRMQFSVDERTNSIIAAGSREDLAVVEAILLRLDEGDLRERTTTVHRLNNAYAQNVAAALQEWLQTERQAESDADVAISPFEQIEREVIIVPELATNSLIVSATPRFYKEVIRVITELDERPPMVLIQVLIAEVRLNDTDEFGVELGLQDSLLFDRSLVGALTTTNTTTQTNGGQVVTTSENIVNAPLAPGFNFNNAALGNNGSTNALATAGNVAAQGLSNFSLGRVNSNLNFGGFVFSASSNAVSVLLRALQEKRRLEVLSRPQLMALDGQTGYVQVGQNVPRIVATNIDTFGGQTNSIQYEPVGLILQVVPRISPDGLVVMQIQAKKAEVGPEAEGIPISISANGQILRTPRIENTEALTTISALSGQTVILGGLLQTRKFDVHRRVPIIADIPLLGDLFRYDSVEEERRELLIILTPQIIYNKMDSDLTKQIESSRMSWILGDVINLHGEAGLRSRCDEWYDGEMESIYPNYVPEEGFLPLSSGQPSTMEGPNMYAPGCEPTPEFIPPMENAEPLPTPRDSPSSSRPVNGGYTQTSAGQSTTTVTQTPADPRLSQNSSQVRLLPANAQ